MSDPDQLAACEVLDIAKMSEDFDFKKCIERIYRTYSNNPHIGLNTSINGFENHLDWTKFTAQHVFYYA